MEKNEFVSFYRCSWLFYVYILRHFFNSGLHVSIIDAALPLVTILFSTLFKEEIRLNYWIGIILGAIGVLFITIPSKSANQVSLIGDILILLSTFLFAWFC